MNNHRTIYIVDDDASARRGLTHLLAAARHEVKAFSSFEEFSPIQTLDKNACLIMDASMSGLSETDLQTVFIQKNLNLRVICLSARDDKASREKALAVNAVGFFHKPVDGPALLDAIDWAFKTDGRDNGHTM
jgi:FixJ family two-component response regulator